MVKEHLKKLEESGKVAVFDPKNIVDHDWLCQYLDLNDIFANHEFYGEISPENKYAVLTLVPSGNQIEAEITIHEKGSDQCQLSCLPGFILPKAREDFNPVSELEGAAAYIDQKLMPQFPAEKNKVPVLPYQYEIKQYFLHSKEPPVTDRMENSDILEEPLKTESGGQEVIKFKADITCTLTKKDSDKAYHSVREYWESVRPLLASPNVSQAQKSFLLWKAGQDLVNSFDAFEKKPTDLHLKRAIYAFQSLGGLLAKAQEAPEVYQAKKEAGRWQKIDCQKINHDDAQRRSMEEKIKMALEKNHLDLYNARDVRVNDLEQKLYLDSKNLENMTQHACHDFFLTDLKIKVYNVEIELRRGI